MLSEYKQPSSYHPVEGHPDLLEEDDKIDAKVRQELAEEQERAKYVPRCPTCGSPDIERISGVSKVASAAMWGLFSNKIRKTFHCNNCGYEW